MQQEPSLESIEIGQWVKDGVFWIVQNGERVLQPIADVDEFLRDIIMGDERNPGLLLDLPWYVVPLAFFVLGLVSRRPTRGLRAAAALVALRSLDELVWEEAQRTLSLTLYAVVVGIVLSIPVGIVAYLSPGLRRALRRVLDSSLLFATVGLSIPLVFVFGLGEPVSAMLGALITMAFMTRAIVGTISAQQQDGLRSGMNELASGVNSSLLLILVMQQTLALIGTSGLARLHFRSINNLNISLYIEAALALMALMIAVDQITRPSRRSGAFFDRGYAAWALPPTSETQISIPPTPMRTAIPTILGAAVALLSLLLPWSTDRGTLTSHVNDPDLSHVGVSFQGLHEHGGSGFGVAIAALATSSLLCVLLRALRRSGPPADLSAVVGAAVIVLGAAFVSTVASPFAEPAGVSVGAIVAIVGGALLLLGSFSQRGGGAWIDIDQGARLGYLATVLSLVVASGLVALGGISDWIIDEDPPVRSVPADIEAEIARLRDEAGDDVNKQLAASREVQDLINSVREPEPLSFSGLHVDGPHTAFAIFAAAGLSLAGTLLLLVAGIERARWLAMGFGFGAALTAAAWISSTAIEHTPTLRPGGGPFLMLLGGAGLAATARRAPIRARNVLSEPGPQLPAEEISITNEPNFTGNELPASTAAHDETAEIAFDPVLETQIVEPEIEVPRLPEPEPFEPLPGGQPSPVADPMPEVEIEIAEPAPMEPPIVSTL